MTKEIRQKAPAAIRQAWANATSNHDAAAALQDMMLADPELWREILAPFEKQAAAMAVQRHKIASRAYLWSRPTDPDQRVAALTRSNAVTMLDMRLTTGLRLGEARRGDVEKESTFYHERASDHMKKASFFDRILERMAPNGRKTVAQVWTAAELEAIRDA